MDSLPPTTRRAYLHLGSDGRAENPHSFLTALILQLATQAEPCLATLRRLYATHRAWPDTDPLLFPCLVDMLSVEGETYIALDGLEQVTDAQLLETICRLLKLKLGGSRVLVASRPTPKTQDIMAGLSTHRHDLANSPSHHHTLQRFILSELDTAPYSNWPLSTKLLVAQALQSKARGS